MKEDLKINLECWKQWNKLAIANGVDLSKIWET
jgi:hypothetical protein